MAQTSLVHAQLRDVDDVQELGPQDHACLDEVREVLHRHGKLDRFGVCLLHSHFPIHDGERLVETCDVERRELWIRPMSESDLNGLSLLETAWHLGERTTALRCRVECVKQSGSHVRKHVTRGG